MNVLLIDDERAALDGMQYLFAKMRPQHRIVGAISDPAQAYSYLSKERIDLVITDVKMPELCGTELSKWIRINYPQTALLVVSAYSDYEYIRAFVQMDAVDYLLKPVDVEDLLACIDNVEQRRRIEDAQLWQEKVAQELAGKRDARNTPRELRDREQAAALLLFKMNENEFWEERLWQIENRLLLGISEKAAVQIGDHNVLLFEDQPEMERIMQRFAERIAALRQEDIHVSAVLYENSGGSPLAEAYDKALGLLEFMTFNEIYAIRNERDLKRQIKAGRKWAMERYLIPATMRNYFLKKDVPGLREYVQEGLERLQQDVPLLDAKHARHQIMRYLIALEREIDFSPLSGGAAKGEMNPEDGFMLIDTAKELFCWLEQFLLDLCERRSHLQVPDYIHQVIQYVEENYTEDIRLTQAAENAFVNPNYLSSQFKRYVGKSFNQYLTECRIEQAKRLLSQNLCRIYEVAEQVGFAEPSYFNAVFKKLTGMTPGEFQKGEPPQA